MSQQNSALKARIYIGGLRSLFADMHDTLEEIEKTGSAPSNLAQSLIDVKDAIDLTVKALAGAEIPCCDLAAKKTLLNDSHETVPPVSKKHHSH